MRDWEDTLRTKLQRGSCALQRELQPGRQNSVSAVSFGGFKGGCTLKIIELKQKCGARGRYPGRLCLACLPWHVLLATLLRLLPQHSRP